MTGIRPHPCSCGDFAGLEGEPVVVVPEPEAAPYSAPGFEVPASGVAGSVVDGAVVLRRLREALPSTVGAAEPAAA